MLEIYSHLRDTVAHMRAELAHVHMDLAELKEMTTRLSDFESCVSSSSEEDETPSTETHNDEFKNVEKKRGWKNKRKNSTSPLGSDQFLKRANKMASPKTNTK